MERKLLKHGTRFRTRWGSEQYTDEENSKGKQGGEWIEELQYPTEEDIKDLKPVVTIVEPKMKKDWTIDKRTTKETTTGWKFKPRTELDKIIVGLKFVNQKLKNQMFGKGQRPNKMSVELVERLVEAFNMDYSVEEACAYAWISKDTYYRRLKENVKFSALMEDAQHGQQMIAKAVIYQALVNNNENVAMSVLEKRDSRYSKAWWEWDVNLTMNVAFLWMMQETANERIEQADNKRLTERKTEAVEIIENESENDIQEGAVI